ncbi:FecR domain-containing protein [Neptuniibacter sp. PT34_22]|uniref:FecR family protein n=1 Tax=Neptuniibacter sp. PT34_22 TaxID=3398205 RepID=UPI0039F5D66D
MSRLSKFSPLVLILLCFLTTPAVASNEIGKVVLIQGKPLVERQNQHLFIKRNDPLFTEDVLITPVGSKILIKLEDKTTISLAENTQFELSKYQFDKKAQTSDVSFKMLKGAFRTLTGSIGKQKQPKFEIHTPVATIGVRGTEFWGGMIFSDALDVTMLEGKGVYIKNKHGQVEITRPGDGTMVSKGMKPSEVSMWSEEKLKKAAAATELKQQRQNESEDYLNY